MRDAYCTTPHARQKVMRDASKLFLQKKPPSADLLGIFLHTGTWHLIYLNINVSKSIASAILSQMFPIRMLSLYSFNKVLYSAGCSSTRLINFSRYLSSITSLYINHHENSTNTCKRRKLCNLQMGQHVVVPGSHARILGGTRENPQNDVMVG